MKKIKMEYIKVFLSLFLFCFFSVQLWAETDVKKGFNIVFIGNSITHGAGLNDPEHDAPPVKAVAYIEKQPTVGSVKFANKGVSGCTTVDYLPETGTLFPEMEKVADQFNKDSHTTMVFSIMLGTNDSAVKGTNGCPVSPEQYQINMRKIVDKILTLYPSCKVILNRPLWYSPNTYNGAMYLQEGLDRLKSYYSEIKKLADHYAKENPEHVFIGDTEGFDYFQRHYKDEFQEESGNAGSFFLHPNQKGAVSLGELWGKAICKCLLN